MMLTDRQKNADLLRMPSPVRLFTSPTTNARATLVVAAAMFAVIAAWRFLNENPLAAIATLYVIPIALLAVTRGIKGGIGGVATALALVVAWDVVDPHISLTPTIYAIRTLIFVAVALVVGWQVERNVDLDREASRWFEISEELCGVANHEGYLTRVNSSWTRILGYTEEELQATPYIAFVHPEDLQATEMGAMDLADGVITSHFENRYRAKDGSWRWLSWSCTSDAKAIYASGRDITDRKEADLKMAAMANEDALTGLANRRAWNDRVCDEMIRAERAGTPMCIAVLDLDKLKQVNDTQGHEAGDRLLRAAAACWESVLRDGDFVARLGGDEFAVIFPDCTEREALSVIERMAAAMPAGYGFSAGVARWDRQEDPTSTVVRSDVALYAAKVAGGNRALLSSELEQPPPRVVPRTA